ncbi:MAG TPA: alpha/beta fold hydrolase [Desulfobacterales bacterium]|jgi:pimeloyl-ACP methyl ester carboxylesterase|nr:alpha/beta fold hydrolase [Desulfobacterales bacterium]
MPYFTTQDGCRIYYETHGFDGLSARKSCHLGLVQGKTESPAFQKAEQKSSKPVVVFLNGTMQNTTYWKTAAIVLEDRFPVLLYDARAQGQSDIGEGGLSLEGHAADLARLLEHLEVEKAYLVGLSHGAKVALVCAANSPERIDRLVLCSISAKYSCRTRLVLRSWLETLRTSGLEAMAGVALPVVFGENFLKQKERILYAIMKGIIERNRKEALIPQLETMIAYPPLSQIAQNVRIPALVISGSDDPLVTEQGARELAKLCSGRHKQFIGVGHSIPTEAPELFNETLLEFLCPDA